MKILFLNNGGAGFADYVEVDENTSIEAFLAKQVHGYKPGDLLIRVNRSLRRFPRLVKRRRVIMHRKFMWPIAA